MRQAEIENLAEQTLQQYGLFSIPVDPISLANKLGIRVSNAMFSDEQLSGLISKRGHNISILVKQADSPFRKRFTIAHELGHHFLHLRDTDARDIVETVDLFRETVPAKGTGGGTRTEEVQANQFAAALLMPSSLVRKAFGEIAQEPDSLARLFNVSSEAMRYRLQTLNLVYA